MLLSTVLTESSFDQRRLESLMDRFINTHDRSLLPDIDELKKEIASKNRLISLKDDIMKLQDENIALRDVKIARQETEITLLRERVQEQRQLIDRLSNSNMNAPQPIIEPQVIQRIA